MQTATEQNNADAVVRLYDAFARRDIPAALATMADDVEWHESDELPWGGTQHGPDRVAQYIFAAALEVVPNLQVTPDQLIASGDTVSVTHRYTGTGFLTGRQLDVPGIGVYDLRDGKIARYRQFVDATKFREVLLAHVAATQLH
jgi:ketosteroid isomerase-like protein